MAATKRNVDTRVRIAIVDDHRLVLDGMGASLAAYRDEFEVVISETSWLGLIGHPDFPVDVVVLDLGLGDRISIGAKIRALAAAGSRCVVVSRHADSPSITGALAAGALAFVPKTDSADELIAAIRAVAIGSHYLAPGTVGLVRDADPIVDPALGAQERRALTLYALGRSIREVADEMGTTDETAKSYIKRARRKYRDTGVDVGTKPLLRRRGMLEGWLPQD